MTALQRTAMRQRHKRVSTIPEELMQKLYPNAAAALEGVLRDNMLIASGGFGLC